MDQTCVQAHIKQDQEIIIGIHDIMALIDPGHIIWIVIHASTYKNYAEFTATFGFIFGFIGWWRWLACQLEKVL